MFTILSFISYLWFYYKLNMFFFENFLNSIKIMF